MGEPAGRLVLLSTTHRVAPGLLSFTAWSTLQAADHVLVRDPAHPLLPALRAAGLEPELVTASGDRALALALLTRARGRSVVLIAGTDGEGALGSGLAAALVPMAERGQAPEVEVLPGSWDLPGARLLDLVAVMDRLRSVGGCPWDAQQTHESLVTYLLEEAYETIEAIETGDLAHLREELGDLLLQVVFHARIASEHPDQPWSVDDVATDIVAKLVRRHPHVFSDTDAPTAEHVEANWEVIKAAEKGRASAVDGIPTGLPALALTAKLMSRAAKAGVAVSADADDPSFGGRLLRLVAEAHAAGADPEAELRAAARRYAALIRAAERRRR